MQFHYDNTKTSSGTYTQGIRAYRFDIDAIYDYQIAAHFITVCKSAGNLITYNNQQNYNPKGDIVSPGYAYNAITVGGVNQVTVNNNNQWIHESYASYNQLKEKDNSYIKPNISAPYTVCIPNIGEKTARVSQPPL